MSNTQKNTDDEIIVSSKVIATILGVTTRRVQQMSQEGIIEKYGTKYKLIPTMQRYIKYLKTSKEATDNDNHRVDYEAEHARLEKAKREKAELQLALMKGKSHLAADIERELTKMLMSFRARILAMPTKLAPRVAPILDINKVESIIRSEINIALKELSDYDPKTFRHKTQIESEDIEDAEIE